MVRSCSAAMTLALAALLAPACKRSPPPVAGDPQRAAAVLLDGYETVFSARGELLAGAPGDGGRTPSPADLLRAPFAYPLAALEVLGQGVAAELLGAADAVLVGARDFRPPEGPSGLGDVQSSFCGVVVLSGRKGFDLEQAARAGGAAPAAPGTWRWTTPGTEGHPRPHAFHATQAARGYVVVCSEPDAAVALATRLSGTGPAPAPAGVRDWERLRQQPLWGYRRYRHDQADPVAAGTSEVKADAEALALLADPVRKAGALRLFAPSAGTADALNEKQLAAPFVAAGDGVWETRIQLTGDERSVAQVFAVMSWFGFGVYL